MKQTTVERIEQLYPKLKAKAYQLIQLASNKGIDCEVSQGLRTWPEQMALYNQGRTTPGPIVTHCPPALSWHTYALAFDVDIETPTGLDWNGTDENWQTVIALGESLGLYSGAEFRTFPDKPHFQYTGRFPVTPDDEVLALYHGGGIRAVWDEVDKGTA